MASLFDGYEQQYSVLTADITSQIGLLSTSRSRDRRQLISNIEKNVEEAQELLEQMELEAREIEPARRQRCRSKVDCYRTELKRLTLEYIKARSVKQSALSCESADELEDGFVSISENQKKRLLDHSERMERSNNRLEEGYKICLETEEIGSQVLDELSDQREVIQRARNRLRETNEGLGKSSRLTNGMIMRAIQQKIVFFIIGACFVVAILLGLYIRFTRE